MKEVLSVQDMLILKNQLFTLKEEWETKGQKWSSVPLVTVHVGQVQREVVKLIKKVEFLEQCKL